jgi:hypothetical protein
MPFPAKTLHTVALLAKLEATYGTAVAVTSTADGQLLAISDRTAAIVTPSWSYDGAVGPAPGNLGMLKRVGAVGRSATVSIPMRAKGAAAVSDTPAADDKPAVDAKRYTQAEAQSLAPGTIYLDGNGKLRRRA